jgi:hypothetical protein
MRYIWLTLALLVVFAVSSCSEVNIDYSHNIKGTGTVMTDYHMGTGDHETGTEATGRVLGTGDITDRYLFSASNTTGNVTVEDEFVMSEKMPVNESTPIPTIYPQLPDPPRFRLTGAAWADRIELNASLRSPAQDRAAEEEMADLNGSG